MRGETKTESGRDEDGVHERKIEKMKEEEAVGEKNLDNYDEYERLDIIGESDDYILSELSDEVLDEEELEESGHVSFDKADDDFNNEFQNDLDEEWEEEMYETVFSDDEELEDSEEFELRTESFDEEAADEYDNGEIYAVLDSEDLSDRDENGEYVAPRTAYSHLMQNKDKSEKTQKKPAYDGSFWRSVHLVDTAGIRRQKSVEGFIEEQSVYRSLRCITECDIVIFMIDATVGISHQDRRLLDIALEKGKSVIVGLNKIDLLKEKLPDEKAKKQWL